MTSRRQTTFRRENVQSFVELLERADAILATRKTPGREEFLKKAAVRREKIRKDWNLG